jgi:hypothetical protein
VNASDIGALVLPLLQVVEEPVTTPGVDRAEISVKLRPLGFRGAVVHRSLRV